MGDDEQGQKPVPYENKDQRRWRLWVLLLFILLVIVGLALWRVLSAQKTAAPLDNGNPPTPTGVVVDSGPATAVVKGTVKFDSTAAGEFTKTFVGRPLFNGKCEDWAAKGDGGIFSSPSDLIPVGITPDFTWANFIAVNSYKGPGTYNSGDDSFFGGITLWVADKETASTSIAPATATMEVEADGSGTMTFAGPDLDAQLAGDDGQRFSGTITWTCGDIPLDEGAYQEQK